MKILFNVWTRTSHLNGFLALARHCHIRGHEVTFFCFDGSAHLKEKLLRLGLEIPIHSPVKSAPFPDPPASHFLQIGRKLQDSEWRQKYLERLFVYRTPAEIQPIRYAIRALDPDIVLSEAVSYAGAIAASLEGKPWATLAAGWGLMVPPGYTDPFATALERLNPLRHEVALSFGVSLTFIWTQVVSPYANFVVGTSRLTPPSRNTPANSAFIRGVATHLQPWVKFPWYRLDPRRPLVYLSSGSEFEFERDIATQLINACISVEAQVVFATLRSLPLGPIAAPERLIKVRYAPQVEILKRAQLFITAGGCSSLLDAVAAKVPVLVVPIGYDQPMNAELVNQSGFGVTEDPWRDRNASLRNKIEKMLPANSMYRARVGSVEWPAPHLDLDITLDRLEQLRI